MATEKKDITGLVYQLIKKLNLLTKRVETIEQVQKELEKKCGIV